MSKKKKKHQKILRVFPTKTNLSPDNGRFGSPDMFDSHDCENIKEVHISVTFTWDIIKAKKLKEEWEELCPLVKLGGPAFGDPGGEFAPGRYVKDGSVITSRGCPKKCSGCLVPEREGKIRTLEIRDGYDILDNNLAACPKDHILNVFRMLNAQRRFSRFTGGIDSDFVSDWFVEKLRGLKGIKDLFLAFDYEKNEKSFKKAAAKLSFLGRRKLRAYCLVGILGDTPEDAEERLLTAWEAGTMPFAMYYQSPENITKKTSPEWTALIRRWTRPAATKAYLKTLGTLI